MVKETGKGKPRCEAAVVVLGDIGRSPRMCNHALMLSSEGFSVKLIGFYDSVPHEKIVEDPNIELVAVAPPPELAFLPPFLQLPFKLFWNFLTLLTIMMFRTSLFRLRLVLMQNPPALPTMIVCFLISKFKSAHFVIDWHNYMYSILKDKYNISDEELSGMVKEKKPNLVRIVKVVSELEGFFGKWSDANICVSNAMKTDLQKRWGIEAETCYDRPPEWKFQKTTNEQIHELYLKLGLTEQGKELVKGCEFNETIITNNDNGIISKRADRPLVLISSTSWTPDERFEILLDGLAEYDRKSSSGSTLPKILMVITGKGPLKEMYLEEIRKKDLKSVTFVTPWLEANDYPIMLASADLGISLHISTSGLDLPMKVVDMFGVDRPVLAKNFSCIEELVKVGENGYTFENSEDLLEKLLNLANGFPRGSQELRRLSEYFEKKSFKSWEQIWSECAKPSANLGVPTDDRITRGIVKSMSIFGCFIVIFIILGLVALGLS